MTNKTVLLLVPGIIAGVLSAGPARAGWPPQARLSKAVTKYWQKTWPDQELAHVTKKTDCEKAVIEDEAYEKRTGKSRKLKACLVKADVFVAKGYRYLIYRDTYVYFVRRRLKSVQLGELEKAWKAGGVPAPETQDAERMLSETAREKMGFEDVEVSINEMGTPRPYKDVYRVSVSADVAYTARGEKVEKKSMLATFESDGTAWKVAEDLAF